MAEAPDPVVAHARALAEIKREMAEQVVGSMPAAAFEALCQQVWLMRDAQDRVASEGSVVADARGNAGEHPAIKIQREAANEVRRWLERYAARKERKEEPEPGASSDADPEDFSLGF